MRTITLIMLLALTGCSHSSPPLSGEPAQAASQIQSWVPVGTPLADARRIMEQHQFTCSVTTNGSFGDSKAADLLYCDRSVADSQVTPIVSRRWQVALVLSDGKISAVRVSTGLIGP